MSIKIENVLSLSAPQWEAVIRGARNPMNSWHLSDSASCSEREECDGSMSDYIIGPKDHKLLMNLRNAGSDHRKYMRMIEVWCDITAPLYWWKEFDTYKIGTVANSCSTMHKIHAKEFTLDDFSHEHLGMIAENNLNHTIKILNMYRDLYVNWDAKYDNTKHALLVGLSDGVSDAWWQMIQLLPSSYNQRRTVMFTYENLVNMYHARKNHKLDEWREFCKFVETLPYSELITGEEK